jgi:ATP-dependent helicase HrpB
LKTATLPITAIRAQFDEATKGDAPIILTAPTGSGKSTQVPIWLSEKLEGPVMVVEPRRVACRSLATWVAHLCDTPLGKGVGHRFRFDDQSSAETRILFVTPGVALRMMREGNFARWGAVVLDEFHERGWQVDLLLTLLLHHKKKGAFSGKLVIASATLKARELAARLKGRHLSAQGRTFPVQVEHLSEPSSPSSRDLAERVERTVVAALRDPNAGDILVFLPGKGEIHAAATLLRKTVAPQEATVLAVHAGLPARELARAFDDKFRGRRVYLSTNVAETSITLPGVRTVIDSGLERRQIHQAGRTVLLLQPVAQSSLEQRSGRAGRVAEGKCIRLFSPGHVPQPAPAPEVLRIELDDVVLQAAAAGLDPQSLAEAPWPNAPPDFALSRARQRLSERGVFDAGGGLTPLGEKLADLPLSARDARVLLDPPQEIGGVLADLGALLDLDRDLFLPLEKVPGHHREEVRARREDRFGDARHEVEAALWALRGGDAKAHGLNGSALLEARRTARQLRGLLQVRPPQAEGDAGATIHWDAVARHLAQRMPEAAFVLRPRAMDPKKGKQKRGRPSDRIDALPYANGDVEVLVSTWRPFAETAENPEPPRAGFVLNHTWVAGRGGRGAVGRGRMLLPAGPKILFLAGLGQEVRTAPSVTTDGGVPRVRVIRQRALAGVVLGEEEVEAQGENLIQSVADLIESGRWMKGVVPRLLDHLHLWDLFFRWPEDPAVFRQEEGRGAPAHLNAHLIDRLTTLGVQTAEDLQLVEESDLEADLVGLFGTDPATLEKMATDFPRQWQYQGATYEIIVNPTARRVCLSPADKKAKKAKEPDAKRLPRFRAFRVIYQQASRTLTLR